MSIARYHFAEIDSTNEEAKRRVAEGRGEPAVFHADTQTAGRGRREREWSSPVGNIYCSVLQPLASELRLVGLQAYVVGLAIARAANGLLPAANARVKWPNDVLVGGHKLAGVLLETAECPRTKQMYLIVGFGVNVAVVPSAAVGAAFRPTSMNEQGAHCTADTMMNDILTELSYLQKLYAKAGFAGIRTLWIELAHGMGESIAVNLPDHTRLHGRFVDLDAEGGLILETESELRRITAGDVFFMPR